MDLGIGCLYYLLPLFPLHIPVWYLHGFICDQVFQPSIDGEEK